MRPSDAAFAGDNSLHIEKAITPSSASRAGLVGSVTSSQGAEFSSVLAREVLHSLEAKNAVKIGCKWSMGRATI